MSKKNEQDPNVVEATERQLPPEAENQIDAIMKTFTTGTGITPDTQHDAASLRREYLEDEVKMLAYQNKDFTIYPMINKQQVNNTVAKYTVFNEHGRAGHTRFVREVGVGTINTPKMRQRVVHMKFVSDTKQQTIASGLVNNIADPMTILTEDAMTVIAKTIEWSIFYGDAELSADDDKQAGLQFDGLHKLIDQKTNVLDIRGKELTESVLNTAAVIVGKGYGRATDAFMPIGVQAEFMNQLLDRQRVLQPAQSGGFATGFHVSQMNSVRGPINLHGSTIMENDDILREEFIPEQNAPLPADSVAVNVASTGGKFRDEDVKTHKYKVQVWADESESIPTEAVEAVVSANADSVELTIKLNPMYGARPAFVSVYRQGSHTGHYFLIGRIPASKLNEDNELEFVDKNDRIPETADVFLGEMSSQVISLFELLPMMRLPLAQMNASVTFSVLWYGALALYAPKKWVRIKNVKYVPALAAEHTLVNGEQRHHA